jgi:hypothetical protein
LLRDGTPFAYARIVEILKRRAVIIVVDREPIALRNVGNELLVSQPSGDESVFLETKRRVILDLVEARCTLCDAVLDDAMHVRGPIEHVVALHDALMAYVEGAVRNPRFPALLDEYLSANPQTNSGSRPWTNDLNEGECE